MLLEGKSIVVTGGNTGIGKAIVLAAAAEGAFFGAQFAARQFVAQRSGGLILTISSTHEDSPMPGNNATTVTVDGGLSQWSTGL